MSTTKSPRLLPPQLQINPTWMSPDWTRVAVVGEVDLSTSPALRAGLLEVLADQVCNVLELDLSALTFLDCIGLSALLDVRGVAMESGCQVLISHPQPLVARVLAITDLLPLFSAPPPTPTRPQTSTFSGSTL